MARSQTKFQSDNIPVLLSLEVGTFPYCTTNDAALSYSLQNTPNLTPQRREKIKALYKNTKIDERYFAIPDFIQGSEGSLPPYQTTSVTDRLSEAGNVILSLATEVTKRALAEAKVCVDDIGQLVLVSSTVIGSPGLDAQLVGRLGLSPNVSRACVNYMGCGAGIVGLRLSSDFVKGLDRDQANRISLVICVEASSLHATMLSNQNNLVTHSLFSDGVTCAVVAACSPSSSSTVGKLAILDFESIILENTSDGICLRMNTEAIECLLSPKLPEAIKGGVKLWLDSLLQRHNAMQTDLDFWAIHPGGPKIIEKSMEGLSLTKEATHFSWEALKEYGNTLSCGIFYVLRKMLDNNAIKPGNQGLAFSFSPGVSVEGVLLQALPAPKQTQSEERLRVKKRQGVIIPSWVSNEVVDRIGELDQRSDDIFVVTYPKAGTTWMLQIVHLLRNAGYQGVLPLNHAVGWIERDGIDSLLDMPSQRIIKTHLPLSLLNPTAGRWIYVARNPKDLAVSYYHHARAKVDFDFLGTWNQFFELFLEGQVEGGDWLKHTATGLSLARERPKEILSMWYETIRDKPFACIHQVASFLGTNTDQDFLLDVVQKSSLDYMRSSPLANVSWTKERIGEAPHLRRGSVGDWRELFTVEQEAALENKWLDAAISLNLQVPRSPDDLKHLISSNFRCLNIDNFLLRKITDRVQDLA